MATTAAAPTAETVRERLRPMLAGRPVVLTGGPLVSATRTVGLLAELSGRRPFVLAFGVGTGTPPEAEAAVVHVLPAEGADLMAAVRATSARLADLPGDALAALDAYDPHREAVVLAGSFCTRREVAGRTSSTAGSRSGRRSRTRSWSTRSGTTSGSAGPRCGSSPRRTASWPPPRPRWTPAPERSGPATPAKGSTAAPSTCAGSAARPMPARRTSSSPRTATGCG